MIANIRGMSESDYTSYISLRSFVLKSSSIVKFLNKRHTPYGCRHGWLMYTSWLFFEWERWLKYSLNFPYCLDPFDAFCFLGTGFTVADSTFGGFKRFYFSSKASYYIGMACDNNSADINFPHMDMSSLSFRSFMDLLMCFDRLDATILPPVSIVSKLNPSKEYYPMLVALFYGFDILRLINLHCESEFVSFTKKCYYNILTDCFNKQFASPQDVLAEIKVINALFKLIFEKQHHMRFHLHTILGDLEKEYVNAMKNKDV